MNKNTFSNARLGIFVGSGLLFLILLLYMIGKNRSMFGSNYILKARFENVHGLVEGDNIRFAGIEAGSVKSIRLINDTLIEVTMLIDKSMENIIHSNAVASIGTEGFVGNKVINIVPSKQPAALAKEGDVLLSKKNVDTDEILQNLSATTNDVNRIASELKTAVLRFSNDNNFWKLLRDPSIPGDIKAAISKIRLTATRASQAVTNINIIAEDLKNGKGSAGRILRDSALAQHLNEAVLKINKVGNEVDTLAFQINLIVNKIHSDVDSGNGLVNALLRDSFIVEKINASLSNIQKGTDNFNQNMEALKHNFLFKGYFRKLEKQQKKKTK